MDIDAALAGGSTRGLVLGVDTGGTTTDAVVIIEAGTGVAGIEVIATAKAPTTHHDLSVGIGAAVDKVLMLAEIEPAAIGLVALSTTLATNAIVEGRGRRAALVTMGFEPEAVRRAGLHLALGRDIHIAVPGGHRAHGEEIEPLDLDLLAARIDAVAHDVDAFAVTGQFSVRNPAHEQAARRVIVERTGLPVTCSHELAASLNGPRRAVTALLNARLIALIDELLAAATDRLRRHGIDAPVMVMRGNGSLVSAAFVADRPIETILSGPAASVVGAGLLADAIHAVVVDTGGTTTDIAVLTNGRPRIDPEGAVVGGHRCMIEAIATSTHGLGGDSEIHHDDREVGPALTIGPRRVIPLARIAMEYPDVVHRMLRRQLRADFPGPLTGRLAWQTSLAMRTGELSAVERRVLDRLSTAPVAVDKLVGSQIEERALDRLIGSGKVAVAAFTPTDACHTLGIQTGLDVAAATGGADLLARRADRTGAPLASDAETMSRLVVTSITRRIAEYVLGASLAHDGDDPALADSPLAAKALDAVHPDTTRAYPGPSMTKVTIGIDRPIVGLGGPAHTFHPGLEVHLATTTIIPTHAEVANAIGAAGGSVQVHVDATITAPRRGTFLLHLAAGTESFHDLDACRSRAETALSTAVLHELSVAGGIGPTIEVTWDISEAAIADRTLFVGATVRATATGRPRHLSDGSAPSIAH